VALNLDQLAYIAPAVVELLCGALLEARSRTVPGAIGWAPRAKTSSVFIR
jgi:hypothetical protein